MNVATFEGVVDQGQIKLNNGVLLPEKVRVYVVVPDFQTSRQPQIHSPKLVHPEQASDFKMEVTEDVPDAKL